jgi:aryl-alcohol dehydrogenase-like predicted oxidoreductase
VPVRRALGSTGLEVFPLCLGGNVFGWTLDERGSFEVLDAYVEGGGNFVDTADAYSYWHPGNSGGESEEIIGAWLRRSGRRDDMVIATKVGSDLGSGRTNLAPDHIRSSVEASLRRLGLDYVDILYAHHDDPATPVADTLSAFDELVRAGRVRTIGASILSAERIEESLATSRQLGLARYAVLQPKYSLVEREFERKLGPLCRDHQLGVLPYLALASGFLTGKYRPGEPFPDTPRGAEVEEAYSGDERAWSTLAALEQVAPRHGASPAQVAIAWLLGRPGVTAPIASATSPGQVEDLLRSTEIELGEEDHAALDGPWEREA